MITLSPLALALIIQALVVLLLLSAVLYWRLRRTTRARAANDSDTEDSAAASVAHYLATEARLTESRLNLLYDTDEGESPDFLEPDWLALRKGYLELEQALSTDKARDDAFWASYGNAITPLLAHCKLVKRVTLPVAEQEDEETEQIRALMEQQQDELQQLLATVEQEAETEIQTLRDKLGKLASSHRELSHCIFVLEEDNRFLRKQIAALLEQAGQSCP